ncbi:MAG: sulfatase-like hydrolase/transferase [Kiritimatiellaceae bacterium]|nr:sulfatase-like hydrolase/transferase [Kiritimatiellaceae bacterium]
MKRKRLLTTTVVGSAGLALLNPQVGYTAGTPAIRPNIIVVVMDDFGLGQCEAYSRTLGAGDMDPHLVELVTGGHRNFKQHDPSEGLQASRQAMPFLTGLADAGVRFNNAYSASSLCAPSRQALLSSRYPQRWGVYNNAAADETGVPLDQRCLPELLHEAGYATAAIGKWHVARVDDSLRDKVLDAEGWKGSRHWMQLRKASPAMYKKAIAETGYCGASVFAQHPLRRGFDYFFGYNWSGATYYKADNIWENDTFTGVRPDGEYNTELFTQKAVDFLDRTLKDGKPAFIYLGYHAVHGSLNYKPPLKYLEKFNSKQEWVNSFYGHVNAVDEGIRSIFEKLKSYGQADNTLFIFTTDNGASGNSYGAILPFNAPSKGAKGEAWQGGHRVPMIASWPGRIKTGRVEEGLVSLMDIMPTAVEASGAPVPAGLDGRSLLPLLNGREKGPVHDTLFFFGIHSTIWSFPDDHYNEGDERQAPLFAAARQGDWLYKVIGSIPPGLYPDLPNGQPKQVLLFNIKNDPGEKNNVIAGNPEVAEALRKKLNGWTAETKPPLWVLKEKWEEIVQP